MALHAARSPLTVASLAEKTKVSPKAIIKCLNSLVPDYVEDEANRGDGDDRGALSRYRLTERGAEIANNIAAVIRETCGG